MLKKIISYSLFYMLIIIHLTNAMNNEIKLNFMPLEYPSAIISLINESDCPISFNFSAGQNKMQFKVDPGFTEMRGSEHVKSKNKIHYSFKIEEKNLKAECVLNTKHNEELIPLPEYKEIKLLNFAETHTKIVCSKILVAKDLFDLEDQYELKVEVDLNKEKK